GCTYVPVRGSSVRGPGNEIEYVTGLDAKLARIRSNIPPLPCWETSISDRLHAFFIKTSDATSITIANYGDLSHGDPSAITFGDTNADGLTDVFVRNGPSTDWYSVINTGAGFMSG